MYASTAFYGHLLWQPGWMAISVIRATRLVRHSAKPEAYVLSLREVADSRS